MAHNIGQMFFVGERPWHELGVRLAQLATLDEALAAGGLNELERDRDLLKKLRGWGNGPVPQIVASTVTQLLEDARVEQAEEIRAAMYGRLP